MINLYNDYHASILIITNMSDIFIIQRKPESTQNYATLPNLSLLHKSSLSFFFQFV